MKADFNAESDQLLIVSSAIAVCPEPSCTNQPQFRHSDSLNMKTIRHQGVLSPSLRTENLGALAHYVHSHSHPSLA
jgi:hypothetical protein